MAISKSEFSNYIKGFQFRELFNEMGWNHDKTRQPIVVDEAAYYLEGMAEKRGFRIFTCEPDAGSQLPDRATRKKIERKVTKLFQEHLIIFIDAQRRDQVWQLAVRQVGCPTKISETRYSLTQDPELLYQRAGGMFFTLDEEEKVTIIDVTKKVAENFQQNNQRITKKFYEGFKKEHTAFLKFIQGIDNQPDTNWYASLMINRLMFCYFIQKKGFLDNNKNYLQDKLNACKEKKGKNRFYSFYRDFLLVFFHKGLGAPEHPEYIKAEIGRIPYLDGGFFDEHEIERKVKNISIEDKAFEKLFNFFDEYEWHLDTRKAASGKDINPDVLGCIFEKYINDRASMGAYYTKEDITDYIAKNCIIPWLFHQVKRDYPKAFAADGRLWKMVKDSGDEYIYDAVKHGVPEQGDLFDDLPEEIKKGFALDLEKKVVDGKGPWLWEMRESWNQPAPSEITHPTEIYREVIERRKRCAELKRKIENGEIKEIDDFITYNLDIHLFAQDVIEDTDDADFIRYFYKALTGIAILDPTCGSGAFLFAAMNILETLYEACILRMKNFIDESGKGKHRFFEEVQERVKAPEHPDRRYFIYKSIILNNLYGVDIINEAVEIAKLRLFLKLVATVEADYNKPNLGLEPLPDMDFNIRAGNMLVGYTTEKQIKEAFAGKFDFDNDSERIKEKCDIVGRAFARYKEIQLQANAGFEDFKKAKDELNQRLAKLREELDNVLHKQHYQGAKYDEWLVTHQPFHWYAEFYEIVADRGGFDVVIGNPPYVVYNAKKVKYKIIESDYETYASKNLYSYAYERSIKIGNTDSLIGLIVQLSAVTAEGMASLQEILIERGQIVSASFPRRPESMFDGVEMPVVILLSTPFDRKIRSSSIYRFYSKERPFALNRMELGGHNQHINKHRIAKLGCKKAVDVFQKIVNNKHSLGEYASNSSNHLLYYQEACRYWCKALNGYPFFKKNGIEVEPAHGRVIPFIDINTANFAVSLLNSSLFYFVYSAISDGEHVNDNLVKWFPLPQNWKDTTWSEIVSILSKDLDKNASRKIIKTKEGHIIEYDELDVSKSKPIIDRIDCLLAQHYGFTQEELDFIINYDIKYRMGKELDSEEE